MSPPLGDDDPPRTPERRSSSNTLLGAFRALASGRLKSPTPRPSVSSTSFTPARSSSLSQVEHVSPAAAWHTSGQHGVLGSQMPTGATPVLEDMLVQLQAGRPLADRTKAAEQIAKVLDQYPIRDVVGLWSLAEDFLHAGQPENVALVGYALLKSCAALPELSNVERNTFFRAARLRDRDNHFDLRLGIVRTLTRDGRDIEGCEALVIPFVLDSLGACFRDSSDASSKARKSQQGKKTLMQPLQEVDNLAEMFQFIINLCKYNSKIFCDSDLETLLKEAMDICNQTRDKADIENCVRLFDTVLTYVYIPAGSLKNCLEVISTIHNQLAAFQTLTWTTLSNVFKSYNGQAAVASMIRTLTCGSERQSHDASIHRAVIQVLQLLLLEDGHDGFPKVPLSLLIPALKASLKARATESGHNEDSAISLLTAILQEKVLRDAFLDQIDWSDFLDIIRLCAERKEDRIAKEDAKFGVKTDSELAEAALSAVGSGSLPGMSERAQSVTSGTWDVDTETASHSDLPPLPVSRSEHVRRGLDDDISKLLVGLAAISHEIEPIQRGPIMELLMHMPNRISDSIAEDVIQFYISERLFHPSAENWLESCRSLVAGFVKDTSRPRSLRLLSIETLRETYNAVEGISTSDTVLQCATLLLNNIVAEDDVVILHELVDFAVDVIDKAGDTNFKDTLAFLEQRLKRRSHMLHRTTSPPAWTPILFHVPGNEHQYGSASNVLASGFVRLFTRSVTKSARKTRLLYDILRHIVATDTYEADARLTAMKLLFRLRADSNCALIVNSSSEGESIAAVLCRTKETAAASDKAEDVSAFENSKMEEHSVRDQRKVSGGSPHSSLNRHTGRQHDVQRRVSKPIPPLWMYPGPQGLPEEPSSQSSRMVFSHIDPEKYPLSDDIFDVELTLWLEMIISILQQKTPDWEIYSYVLVHLGPQLSNQTLVRSCARWLKMLRSVLCEQLRNSSFPEPPSYTLLKRADVAVCLYHVLTVLISYHDLFEKSEDDDIVKAFLHGMGYWDRTANWCIHALTVCCQEMPLSVSKSLDNIIQKMSQIITKPSTAIHILEFLTSLARMPELLKNFRDEEFKMVFGVSFRYLQHVRDQRDRPPTAPLSTHKSIRHSGNFTPPDPARKLRSAGDDLPQYVYALAYHVIVFWFMALKMEDRPKQIPWITKNLHYADANGGSVMEEQGQVIVDLMNLVAHSDRDETTRDPNFAKPSDGEVWKKTWIVGHSLLTIETAARTGVSMITTRRPSGTRFLVTRPLLSSAPRHQAPVNIGLASETFHTSSYVGILPDDIFQTFYAPLSLYDHPIVLNDDPATRRAIDTFDRNPTVDGHKVGVIYIGEGQMGQKCEKDILINDIGSEPYTSFLCKLGTLMRLKGATFNTGGLDRNDNMDGEFTYCWRDRCIELVFHIPTMMPTASDPDLTYANKKRHIGNDFVNIIFNDSGLPYDFDTFPSAFNYVAIVITPESRASFVDRRLAADPNAKHRYYKVQVISKPGFPDISPAVEPKLLSSQHLPGYCRLLAINAAVFSQVWASRDGGESISPWRNRLRDIKRLRERYGANAELNVSASPVVGGAASGAVSPAPREPPLGIAFRGQRGSVASGGHDGTN